jgi:hypothetical protein
MNSITKLVALLMIIGCVAGCQTNQKRSMKTNKEFVREVIGQKKSLGDYPERINPDLTIYEPSSLPFGGVYKGVNAFKQLFAKVKDFYDFKQLNIVNIYEDANSVFVIINAVIAKTNEPVRLCEQLKFDDAGRVKEVMLFIYDFDKKPIHTILEQVAEK